MLNTQHDYSGVQMHSKTIHDTDSTAVHHHQQTLLPAQWTQTPLRGIEPSPPPQQTAMQKKKQKQNKSL